MYVWHTHTSCVEIVVVVVVVVKNLNRGVECGVVGWWEEGRQEGSGVVQVCWRLVQATL